MDTAYIFNSQNEAIQYKHPTHDVLDNDLNKDFYISFPLFRLKNTLKPTTHIAVNWFHPLHSPVSKK